MLSEKMTNSLCEQMSFEFYSAYLYLSLSATLEHADFTGMAAWLRKHAEEELGHGKRFYDYLVKKNASVTFKTLPAPAVKAETPLDVFRTAFEHEKSVSQKINALAKLASAEGDFMTLSMLNWFLDEQLEEEDQVRRILDRLVLAAGQMPNLFLVDEELSRSPEASEA